MKLAFIDSKDGYYECESLDGRAPLWADAMIPTAVRSPPAPTPQQQRDALQAQIEVLEVATKMNRFVREAMLAISVKEAAASLITEAQLYAANIGYKKIKDLNTTLVALRLQMEAII